MNSECYWNTFAWFCCTSNFFCLVHVSSIELFLLLLYKDVSLGPSGHRGREHVGTAFAIAQVHLVHGLLGA
jgi:hypothetical protein